MRRTESSGSDVRVRSVLPVDTLDSESVRLGNRLLRLLSSPTSDSLDAITDAVDGLIGTDHDLFFHDMRITSGAALGEDTGAVLATEFWLPPDPEIGVMLVDLNVVEHWLETLLDDEPPRMRRLSPLGQRDFGLATFLLLHVADALADLNMPPVVLASEPPPRDDVLGVVRDVSRVAEVVFGVTSARSAGLIRLYVPEGLVQSLEAFRTHRDDRRARLEGLWRQFPDSEISMTCRLGRTLLTPSEVDYLEFGDVLLPDEHSLEVDGVESSTRGIVLLPRGVGDAGWTGSVRPSDTDTWSIEIHSTSAEQKVDMSEDVADEEQTEMIERASVEVEFGLGEISMPLGELADLKPGFVLETERQVGDGIDIITGGRKIATGELVSIEGRLGIRIVSLAR